MNRKDAGFTLIEALITLSIAALFITLALPALDDLLQRQRTASALHQLSADFALARTRAIVGRRQVVVCPRTADDRCRDGGDWSQGWLVFVDGDGNRQPDAAKDVLRITSLPNGNGQLQLSSTRPFLRYQSDGRSAHSNLTVHVCATGQLRGQVVVNNHGRARSSRQGGQVPCPRG
ncbi:MAG: GspH/FimT family pseudopilin [Proteobacteria bacterium]|nr:GspH/FimT family pseudopilin [Pseudomonadota bacterium]